ncbi:hypothetical protein N2152v2_005015 [Parachlorella kessleri]
MPIYSNPSVGAGQRYRHLRVLLDQRGKYKQVQIPETCAEQLRSQGVSQLRVINHLKTVEYSVYDGTPDHCTYFNGTWFMLSHAAGEQLLNIFDRLSTEWYHMWLVRKRLFSQHEGPLFITHMNGNRGGTSHPFLPIYRALGEYRQWEDLGVAEAGCLEFEDVLMWSTSWVHIANPVVVPESGGGPLQEFVDAVLEALDVASVQPDSCPRLALYSARENHGKDSRRARWVLNADQVLAAMKETLQGFYEVQRVNMAKMEFVESMRLMRRASIYVFPHGGSGPNLLWMRRGTVAVELFPYKSADPMYRNLAALTGKVYLSWQAQEFAEKGAKATASCGVFEYKSIDPAPFQTLSSHKHPYAGTGQQLQDLKVSIDETGHYTRLQVPERCAQKLGSHGVHRLRVTGAHNNLQELDYSVYGGGLGNCTHLNGTWLILTAGDQLYNLYHLLSGDWYHTWMVRKKLFPQHEGPLYITHLNGIREGRSHPFLPIYQPLGEYRHWEELGDANAGCLQFQDAVLWSTAYILGTIPEKVPASGGSPLQEFLTDVLTTLEVDSIQLDSCPRLALYSARDNSGQLGHKARWVINADQVLAAMEETLQPHYTVQRVVLAKVEFVESMRLMRRASIYVFPHGGSGPNLLWMRRGTVVIELFPFKSADPMYRNFAVLTGKLYLSWQAQEFAEKGAKVGQPGYKRANPPHGYHFNSKSAFHVAIEELVPLLRTAAWVVKANQGDGNRLQELDYSVHSGDSRGNCTYLNGTWLLLSAGDQLHNIFDRLSNEWYHTWLVTQKLFSQRNGPLYITHLNGNKGGRSHPFLPIYQPLGEYRQWEDLRGSQAVCLEFEDVVMWSTAFIFATVPVVVPGSGGSPLHEFVTSVLATLEVDSVQLDSCPRLALYSARDNSGQHGRRARWVINADEVLAAMKGTLQPYYEVQRVIMGKQGFVESMRLMRRASIYVFPHGGSGPNLLWMRRGTVVIELFPFKSADPMYRNLAVLTGKVYFSWQAEEFAEKGAKVGQPGYTRAYEHQGGYHFNSKKKKKKTTELCLSAALRAY